MCVTDPSLFVLLVISNDAFNKHELSRFDKYLAILTLMALKDAPE